MEDKPYEEEIVRLKHWGSQVEDQEKIKEELEQYAEPNCFSCHHPRIFHREACTFKFADDHSTKPVPCKCQAFNNSNLTFFKQISENEQHNEETLKKWREEHPNG